MEPTEPSGTDGTAATAPDPDFRRSLPVRWSRSQKYWAGRYDKRGHVGAVCGETANDLRYWRNAVSVWELVKPVITDMLRVWPSPRDEHFFNRVLDLGCGSGRFIPFLLSIANEYVGADRADQAIKVADTRFGCPETTFFQAVISDLPRELGKFDLIWSCAAMQHVVDPADFERACDHLADHVHGDGAFLLLHENSNPAQLGRNHCQPRSPHLYMDMLKKTGWAEFLVRSGVRDGDDAYSIIAAVFR